MTSAVAVVLDNRVMNIALKTISDPKVGPRRESQSQLGGRSTPLHGLYSPAAVHVRGGRRPDRPKRMLRSGCVPSAYPTLMCSYAETLTVIWARAVMRGSGGAGGNARAVRLDHQPTFRAEGANEPRFGIWPGSGVGIAIGR